MAPSSLKQLRIAAPCDMRWEAMAGDNRVRHCMHCNKNVYNISAMSRREAEALIASKEGTLCAHFYRRADGTILTDNCPPGLRRLSQRVSRVAGLALSAGLSVYASVPLIQVAAAQTQSALAKISGLVKDPGGVPIAGVVVELTRLSDGAMFRAKTGVDGQFILESLPAGVFNMKIQSPGFRSFQENNMILSTGSERTVSAILELGTMGGAATDTTKGSVMFFKRLFHRK